MNRLLILILLAHAFAHSIRAEERTGSPPKASQLQSGDLIWPKKPGAVIPYSHGEDIDYKKMWQQEKKVHLSHLEVAGNLSHEERARQAALEDMSYSDFLSEYCEDKPKNKPVLYGTGGVSVGHVGIIEVQGDVVYVVEAMLGIGVRRIEYSKWLGERVGEVFWVGRLKEMPADVRSAVARSAAKHLNQPYDFWNFNLTDSSGFYCSKLAWLAIYEATKLAPDDDVHPKRALWYSPKQLMKSRYIEMIVSPEKY